MPSPRCSLTASVGAIALLTAGCGGGKSGGGAGATSTTTGSPAAARLAAAQALWTRAGLRDYSYSVTERCFCPSVTPAAVVVHEGRGRTDAHHRAFATVPRLFRFVREAIHSRPARLTVRYDPKLGYPRSVYIDPHANVSDDELGIDVTRFRSGR